MNSCIKHSQLAVSGQYRAAEAAPQTSKFAVRGGKPHGSISARDRSQVERWDRGNFEINNPLN